MSNRLARLNFVAGVAPGYLGMRSSARKSPFRRVFPNVNWARLVKELTTVMPRSTLAARLHADNQQIEHWLDGSHIPCESMQESLSELYMKLTGNRITAIVKRD